MNGKHNEDETMNSQRETLETSAAFAWLWGAILEVLTTELSPVLTQKLRLLRDLLQRYFDWFDVAEITSDVMLAAQRAGRGDGKTLASALTTVKDGPADDETFGALIPLLPVYLDAIIGRVGFAAEVKLILLALAQRIGDYVRKTEFIRICLVPQIDSEDLVSRKDFVGKFGVRKSAWWKSRKGNPVDLDHYVFMKLEDAPDETVPASAVLDRLKRALVDAGISTMVNLTVKTHLGYTYGSEVCYTLESRAHQLGTAFLDVVQLYLPDHVLSEIVHKASKYQETKFSWAELGSPTGIHLTPVIELVCFAELLDEDGNTVILGQ